MSYQKFIISTVTAATVAYSGATITHGEEVNFPDVESDNVHSDAIMELVKGEVISGYPDGTFRPNAPIKRGHAAIMFVRALKLDVPSDAMERLTKFEDVDITSQYAGKVAALDGEGILSEQEFRAEDHLTREEMASWLARAFKLEEKEDKSVTLTDADKVSLGHLKNIELLYQNAITLGKGDGTFDPKGKVTRAEFATFFYRSLNSMVDTIVEIRELEDLQVNLGEVPNLPETVEVTLESGKEKEVKVAWEISDFNKDEEGTYLLQGKLNGIEEYVSLSIIVESKELDINSVESKNLKQIEIEFNHSRFENIDVEDVNLYSITDEGENTDVEIINADLKDNKLLLTMNKSVQGQYLLSIDKAILGYEKEYEINFIDTTFPEIEGVQSISKNIVQIRFSEPMNFKVENGKEVTNWEIEDAVSIVDGPRVRSITIYEHGKVANVELSNDLEQEEYTLSIEDELKDYFGFKLEENMVDFDVVYDNEKPEIVEVKNLYPNQFTLVFDEDIKFVDEDDPNEYFHHTSHNTVADSVSKVGRNEILVTFDEDHLLSNKTEIIVDYNAISDLWGNRNNTIQEDVELRSDDQSPFIKGSQMIQEEKTESNYVQVRITYNEPVFSKDVLELENYILQNSSDEDIRIKRVEKEKNNGSEYEVILTLDQRYGEFPNDTYTLYAKNISDFFKNEADSLNSSFEAGSIHAPDDFSGNIFWNEEEDQVVISIEFDREMAVTGDFSVSSLGKYELQVKEESILLEDLEAETDLEVDIQTYDDGKKVELFLMKSEDLDGKWLSFFEDLTDAIEDHNLSDVQLKVGRIEDNKGNKTNSISNNINLSITDSFGVEGSTIAVQETDRIQFSLSNEVRIFEPDDFIVFADENNNSIADEDEWLSIDNIELDSDYTTITIYLNDEMDEQAQFNNDSVYVATISNTETTNRFGQKLKLNPIELVDKIAPSVLEEDNKEQVFVHEAIGDEEKAVISIQLTDDIDSSTVTRLTFEIGKGAYDILDAYVEGDMIYLVIDLNGDDVFDVVGEYVEQKAPIADKNNNLVTDMDVLINDEKQKIDIDDLD